MFTKTLNVGALTGCAYNRPLAVGRARFIVDGRYIQVPEHFSWRVSLEIGMPILSSTGIYPNIDACRLPGVSGQEIVLFSWYRPMASEDQGTKRINGMVDNT
jgi:hypothetical protein